MSNEARVLKQIRMERGLSMRQAGERLGKSDSYISQIENGRMRVPGGAVLERLLIEVYEYPSVESFRARVRHHQQTLTTKDRISELLKKTSGSEDELLLKIIQAIVA